MDILKKIDGLRKSKGWSLYKLAEECMLPQSTLANMFARNTLPSISTLQSICDGLGISLSEFFDESPADKNATKNLKLTSLFNSLTEKEQQAIIKLMEELSKQ